MARRKTLMNEIHDELGKDRELNALYQRELARLQIANQIAKLRERVGISQAELARGEREEKSRRRADGENQLSGVHRRDASQDRRSDWCATRGETRASRLA